MLNKINCEITATDTTESLQKKLADLGANILLQTLQQLEQQQLHPLAQDSNQASYATKISKNEARINWQESAVILDRKIRAFNPWPVAHTEYNKEIIRIWRAESLAKKSAHSPGTIVALSKDGIEVATGEGALKILELQIPGSKRISATDFINSQKKLQIDAKFV